MIAYLQGTIKKKFEKNIIIDTGNIGYLVSAPIPLLDKFNEKDDIALFIHTKVREDDISLYGFDTIEELDFFKTLININGIGAKLAMEILSQNSDRVKSAILSEDTAYLTKIPGIGKKTAERIIVELKNKADWKIDTNLHGSISTDLNEDAINALMSLGYQKFEIVRVMKKLPEDTKTVEEIVTFFLQNV